MDAQNGSSIQEQKTSIELRKQLMNEVSNEWYIVGSEKWRMNSTDKNKLTIGIKVWIVVGKELNQEQYGNLRRNQERAKEKNTLISRFLHFWLI